MATGTIILFEEFSKDLASKVHDLSGDTFRYCFLDNTTPPTASDATPRYADYSANEVTGTGYVAKGQELDNFGISEVDGVTTVDFDDEVFAYNAAGFNDAYWGLIFNDDAGNDEAIGYQELGGPIGTANGAVTVGPNAAGLVTITVPAEV